MNRLKKNIPFLVISSIFIVAFTIISFLIFDFKKGNFWCGYLFVFLSWLCLTGSQIVGTKGGKEVYQYNVTLFLFSILHLFLQLIIGVVIMENPEGSMRVGISISVFIFALYLMLAGVIILYKRRNER